jgi:DNA-binding NarL/FixJ family response regulator
MNQPLIRLALVDDDGLVVQLLTELLESSKQANFQIIMTARTGNGFLRQLEHAAVLPDIVILDLKMKDGDGLYVLEMLQHNAFPIKSFVLTSYYKPTYIGQIIELGASAFFPKEIDRHEVVNILLEVYHKGHYFTTEQVQSLREQLRPRKPTVDTHPRNSLTDREIEVIELIAQQYTTKQIAQRLYLSPKTIEAHKSNIFSKTGTKNTAGLIIYAIQNELIDPKNFVILD